MDDRFTIALIYDFDGTLAPGNMQEYDFIPAVGKSNKEFWHDSNELARAQDADMTDGASILIFRAEDYGFENIKAGDVIEGLTGTMEVYNNLLEFLPTETLTVSESGRALHVDTLSFAEIEANILD